MEISQVLNALERERELLQEFHLLSSRQLALLENENVKEVGRLLDARSDLMLELTAIETTLGTWITQLRNDSKITDEILEELRTVNDEIVGLANDIVELDEQTHWRLDLIRQNAGCELQGRNRSENAVPAYSMTVRIEPISSYRGTR